MSTIRRLLVSTLIVGPTIPCAAQTPTDAPLTPAGWAWRTDSPASPQRFQGGKVADATFEFTRMAPGWHITMGPGGVLFDPRERAAGRFVLEGEMILFPDASDAEYGVFVGGADLDGANATWIAFLVRADGSAAAMRHVDGTSRTLLPWTAHAAVKARVAGATAKNIVTVRAEPDSVRFLVNGERVGAWSRADLAVDGGYGFRIGRGVNLHITNLDLTRRLAPHPRR